MDAYARRVAVHQVVTTPAELRRAVGQTQVQVAEVWGRPQPKVSRLEAHFAPRWRPSPSTRDQLAATLPSRPRSMVRPTGTTWCSSASADTPGTGAIAEPIPEAPFCVLLSEVGVRRRGYCPTGIPRFVVATLVATWQGWRRVGA